MELSKPSACNSKPLLVAVAPNGARRTQQDHPKLPITPRELAETAAQCCEAGASMLHLHVRDKEGVHSLCAKHYRAAVKEIEQAVGDRMLIQLTSEAAGRYQTNEQMSAIKELAPRCVSLGLREIVKDEKGFDEGQKFLRHLLEIGCLIQFILYGKKDIIWYNTLCANGVIPTSKNLVLLVFGRHGKQQYRKADLQDYLDLLQKTQTWMVCAFGAEESEVMRHAIQLGGHARVGFENNLWMPNGDLAKDNAGLVSLTVAHAKQQGRALASASEAAKLSKNTA